jgi:4-amino-4-deoxy-L-arabinose transferase-like glycosyltransferase
MRVSTVNLAIVMAVAALLRFWALGHGIPGLVSADEAVLLEKVVAMIKAGDFNPRFFEYGGLIFYAHVPVVVGRFVLGAITGRWASLGQVGPADFYFGARLLTMVLGTATVFLLFQLGQRWGSRHALLGAGLLAVMPLHVAQSHYAHPDVPATFFVTLTMLLSLVAHERATTRAFVWAGVSAGLAGATMYGAGIALALPLVAAWMTLHATPSRLRCAIAVVGAALGAFLVTAPYTVLDLPGFLNGVAALAYSYRAVSPAPTTAAWLEALVQLRFTLGWPATLLLIAGFVLGIVRAIKGPGQVRWTMVITFSILYLAMLACRSVVIDRDVLPLLPISCLFAAVAVVSGVSLLRRFDIPHAPRRALIAGLTIAALLPPLIASIAFDRRISVQRAKAAGER